mgnify:CR=1 FL=1
MLNSITVDKKPNNFIIIGHKGSFGNHIRQLLLLSKEFEWNQLITVDSKLEFIIDKIYPATRTWNNWLYHEANWRKHLEKLIPFAHNIRSKSQFKRVILLSDPELAYRSYIKFSSNLDVATKETFLSYCVLYNANVEKMANSQDIVLSSSNLFQEELEQEWYTALVTKLNLSNEYEHAQQLHAHWYQLHRNAEKTMLVDLTHLFLDK